MRHLRTLLTPVLLVLVAIVSLPVVSGDWARLRAHETLEADSIKVIDGDTLQVGERVHDIFGIDAPEWGQRCLNGDVLTKCGSDAAFSLKKRIDINPLSCRMADESGPHPSLVCMSGGESIAGLMLKEGSAVASANAPAEYRETEETARRAGLGLWRGSFVVPSDWRAGARLPEERQEPEPCPVLGVALEGGERVYLVPTDGDYKAASETPAAERFCGDAAARAAGYRRPGEASRR